MKTFQAGIYQFTGDPPGEVISFHPLEIHEGNVVWVIEEQSEKPFAVHIYKLNLLAVTDLFYEEDELTLLELRRILYERWAKLNAMHRAIRKSQPKPLHVHKNLHTGGSPPS